MKHTKIKFRFNQLSDSKKHQLYIYDDITAYGHVNWETYEFEESETSANYFREELNKIPDGEEIELFVNSNGGSVQEGISIYNMLKRKNSKKTCYIDGVAYSVASVICLACDKIIMGLGTSMLIHNMWMSYTGNAKEFRKVADDLDVLMEANRKIYLERAKDLTEEQLIEMMDKETILTPEQCLKYGFCDEIAERKIDGQKVVDSEVEKIRQQKMFILEQKSLRKEYMEFIKGSKLAINDNEKKKFKCESCGYIYEGEEPPEKCPECGNDADQFTEITSDKDRKKEDDKKPKEFNMNSFLNAIKNLNK